MPLTDNQSRERIRELNDRFRKTLDPTLGRMVLTAGVDALPSDMRATCREPQREHFRRSESIEIGTPRHGSR